MAFEFRLPDVGEGLAEAEIVEWRVAVGDVVSMDQVVVDVETDKAVVEIPIPVAGTILHLGGAEGATVPVGSILVVVGEPGESWPDQEPPPTSAATPAEQAIDSPAVPIVGTLDSEATLLAPAAETPLASTSPIRALPVVRKLAQELGVDLEAIRGTGPAGRVTREDVITAAEGDPEPGGQEHEEVVPAPRVHDAASGEGRAMSGVRRAIAERMSRSWAEIPHVTAFDEVDATRLLEVKRALSARSGSSIPLDALIVKAVVPALASHPDFNARLEGDRIIDNQSYDVGLAVDTPDGLMVVVVRDVAARTLTEVASEVLRLAEAAKARTATPAEMSRQSFTVSNIGAIGGGHGTPIVPHGTIGILSVGRAVDRPVARHGRVTIAPVMPLSLSYDHRLIDGGQGRRFLAQIVENLTEPALFLAD